MLRLEGASIGRWKRLVLRDGLRPPQHEARGAVRFNISNLILRSSQKAASRRIIQRSLESLHASRRRFAALKMRLFVATIRGGALPSPAHSMPISCAWAASPASS